MSTLTGTINLNNLPLGEAVHEVQTENNHIESQVSERLRARRETAKTTKRTRSKRASRNLFFSAAALIIAVFILIGMSAYAASIQHANNILEEENAYIQAEIDSLQSQIVDETRVTRIEKVATQQFGMVYPSAKNVVKLGNVESEVNNLAAAIRSEAYN